MKKKTKNEKKKMEEKYRNPNKAKMIISHDKDLLS